MKQNNWNEKTQELNIAERDLTNLFRWVKLAMSTNKEDARDFVHQMHILNDYVLASDGARLHKAPVPRWIPSGTYEPVMFRGNHCMLRRVSEKVTLPASAWSMHEDPNLQALLEYKFSGGIDELNQELEACSIIIAAHEAMKESRANRIQPTMILEALKLGYGSAYLARGDRVVIKNGDNIAVVMAAR